jgi:hypothetical protein
MCADACRPNRPAPGNGGLRKENTEVSWERHFEGPVRVARVLVQMPGLELKARPTAQESQQALPLSYSLSSNPPLVETLRETGCADSTLAPYMKALTPGCVAL